MEHVFLWVKWGWGAKNNLINYKIYIDKEWSKESTAYILGFV